MKQVAQEFLGRMNKEEERICHSLADDKLGLGFLTAIKEFDFYYYNLVRNESSDDADEQFYLMRLGLPRFIEKLLQYVPQFQIPTATFKSEKTLILGALSVVAQFGFVEHGRRMCYAALAGECEIARVNQSLFEFRLPESLYNYEATEAHIENHYRQQFKQRSDALIDQWLARDGISEHLDQCFRDNVYVFHEHFIGYNAHPDLDEFFFGMAYSDLLYRSEIDIFHYNISFGGLKYLHYTLCLAYLLSISLKHERFCEALIAMHPHLRLRDILTVTGEKEEFIANIQEALNYYGPRFDGYTSINLEEATQLYKVLSVRRDNLQLLRNSSMCVPCLVEFSTTAIVKSIAGTQLEFGNFLLQSLRVNFPHEYDARQQTRERSMQRALQRILSETLPSLKFRGNLRLRIDGRILTDVDFVAIDEVSRTVILFQLKYQDHYGGDVRRRSSRGARLKKETENWLNASKKWLRNTPRMQISTALQLKKHVQIDHFYLVAIGKQFAHFLAPLAADEDFAYASWIQFYDALVRVSSTPDRQTLDGLFSLIRSHLTHKVSLPQTVEGSTLYSLESLSYRVVQKNQGASA